MLSDGSRPHIEFPQLGNPPLPHQISVSFLPSGNYILVSASKILQATGIMLFPICIICFFSITLLIQMGKHCELCPKGFFHKVLGLARAALAWAAEVRLLSCLKIVTHIIMSSYKAYSRTCDFRLHHCLRFLSSKYIL